MGRSPTIRPAKCSRMHWRAATGKASPVPLLGEPNLNKPGPLSAGTVTRAIDMAQTSRHALDGVDFALRLNCLASTGSDAFRAACAEVGVSPASFDRDGMNAIDDAMRERFDHAAEQGQSPVTQDTAHAWLVELVKARSGTL